MRILFPMLLLALLVAGCDSDALSDEEREHEAIRDAVAGFADIQAARAAGYFAPSPVCVGVPGMGAMGIHYVHPGLLGLNPQAPVDAQGRVYGTDGNLDLLRPESLLYLPRADGSMQLIGVEYMVFEAPWRAAGNTGAPTFQGTPFDYVADDPATPQDEARGMAPHYALHAWLLEENPGGMFAPFNPRFACP